MSVFTLIWGNIRRKIAQSSLSIVTIAVAFLIYGVLLSFLWFFHSGTEMAKPERIITTNRVHFTQSLPLSYVSKIAAVRGVETVSHSSWFGGYYREPRDSVPVFAVDAPTYLKAFPEIELSGPERAAFLNDRNSVIVGETTARVYGWSVGQSLPLKSSIFPSTEGASWHFRIAGIFSPSDVRGDSRSIYMHFDRLNEGNLLGRDRVGLIITKFKTGDDALQGTRLIDRLFANSPDETQSQSEESFNRAFLNQIGDIVLIVEIVVGTALFIVLVVVTNTMLLSVSERRSEHGLLKAIGFSSRFLFLTVLGEALLLSALGGITGLLLAAFGLMTLGSLFGGFLPGLIMPLPVIVGGAGLILLVSFIVGIVPATLARRTDPVVALRNLRR